MFVILGVSGNTGSVVAQNLLDRGQPVRVVVRAEEKGTIWKEKGAEVAVADIMDIAAMTKALIGADGAYFLLPPDLENEKFLDQSIERANAIVDAAKAARLPHAVILSSVGAQHTDRVGPISTLAYLERSLLEAHIPLTAVRPGYFLENILSVLPAVLHDGIYPSMVLPLDFKIDMVATQDIGLTVADALLNPPVTAHRVIELKGVEQYSANDVAAELSKVLGREITPIAMPQESWVETLKQTGLSQQSAESIAEMNENINNGRIQFLDPNAKKGTVDLSRFAAKLVA